MVYIRGVYTDDMTNNTTAAPVYKLRYFETGQPVVAMGRDSLIVEGGVYREVELVRVMDVASGRTWGMQAWRIRG